MASAKRSTTPNATRQLQEQGDQPPTEATTSTNITDLAVHRLFPLIPQSGVFRVAKPFDRGQNLFKESLVRTKLAVAAAALVAAMPGVTAAQASSALAPWGTGVASSSATYVPSAAPSPSATLNGLRVAYAAPAGAGATCSPSSPCSIQIALGLVSDGGAVVLKDGDYPKMALRDVGGRLARFNSNVVIHGVGNGARLHGVQLYAPRVTISGVHLLEDGVFVRPGADWSRLDRVDFDGEGKPVNNVPAITLAADHSALTNSALYDRLDGDLVFVGMGGHAVRDVTISDNKLGPAAVGPLGSHVDCLQIATQAQQVRVLRNVIFGCSNSGLIIKADHGPIDDVLVANNFIQGCETRTADCAGYNTLYVRKNSTTNDPLTRIRVDHNTITGWVSVDPDPGILITGNIIEAIYQGQEKCGTWLQYNLIATTGCRRTLPSTNAVGQAVFRDVAQHDLRLLKGSQAIGLGGPSAMLSDIDGLPRQTPSTAGASESRF
ncbi:MAG: hypothetical protein JWP57_4205 [Spirosoma sp.]|nr:hypothetical protein [Spirosoma sp.]